MNTDHTTSTATQIVDLTGLPESVVQQVMQLVQQARQKQTEEVASLPKPGEQRPGIIGGCSHTSGSRHRRSKSSRKPVTRELPVPSK